MSHFNVSLISLEKSQDSVLRPTASKTLSCESILVVQMWCCSGNSKNCEHGKYECVIPFMWCGSEVACGSIADVFHTMELQGLCSGKWVCSAFPPIFSFVFLVMFDCYQQLPKVFKMPATVIKDKYKKT